jgi:protein-L-isoaspartate(D-aspartate) O-methyltransferase
MHARMIDRLALGPGSSVLHIGAGLGYYAAIMAHLVGQSGSVTALEIAESLAEAARSNLSSMPWVDVRCADGSAIGGELDAILVNAGVTHPARDVARRARTWRASHSSFDRRDAGHGADARQGVMAMIRRTNDGELAAEILSFMAIYSAIGLRDHEIEMRLGQALRRTSFPNFTGVRRDAHEIAPSCWLHTGRTCLSMAPV